MSLDDILCRVLKGDCLDLMYLIPDKSVDMICCDLPYETTRAIWDQIIPFGPLWAHYERIIKDNGAILLFAQTPFDKVLGSSNLPLLRYEWIWEKTSATGHQNAKTMCMKAHENILVFYKKLPTYNPQKTTGHKPINSYTKYVDTQNRTELYGKVTKEVSGGGNTDRYPRSVLKFSSDKQKNRKSGFTFSTQKPLALIEYFIKTYSNEGDIILDNCSGSFTTSVACDNLKRKWIAMEKEQKHCELGFNRINDNRLKLGMDPVETNY